MAQAQIRSIIIGLLEVKRHRGLQGPAIQVWATAALEVLLQAELDRIEEKERINERG